MQDVADLAEVSVMTVSNVINGRTARVGDDTRERVLAVIQTLGYRVNVSARQLRLGRTGLIGFAVPDFRTEYYGALAERLSARFAEHGFRLVVVRTGGVAQAEIAALTSSSLDAYDGLVLTLARSEASDLEKRRPQKPVVLIGERALSARFDHVIMDNVGGARLAAEHLLASGSRRIALIGGERGSHESMPELRTQGYLEAHAARGIPVHDELLVSETFTMQQGYDAARRLLRDGVVFDSVMAVTDIGAVGVLRALAESGLQVPKDVQVVGWDDLEMGRYSFPALSTVEPANEDMADAIASLLVSRITGQKQAAACTIVMPSATLRLRESTR